MFVAMQVGDRVTEEMETVNMRRASASDSQGGGLVYLLQATDGILSMLSHLFRVLELCK